MDQFGQFTDHSGMPFENDYIHRENAWGGCAYFNPWNASLATRFSDVVESKLPLGITPPHDMERFERFLVQPQFTHFSVHTLQSSPAELNMHNSLTFNKPYEAAYPDGYPRQGSPTETNSSRRSVCHSDDASTDRTARHSLSSMSDYSPVQLSYPTFSPHCSQIAPGGGIALSEIQQYPDESPTESEEYETTEEMEQDVTAYEHDEIRCGSKIELHDQRSDDIYSKDEPAVYERADSEQADVKDEEDGSDTEYKPNRKSSISKRPRRCSSQSSTGSNSKVNIKRHSHGRKGSLCGGDGRVKKSKGHKSKPSNSDNTVRPFFCPFAGYRCESTFTSKNEWKRHVSTQHIKLGFWRCDMCSPSNTSDPYNDFNRKDLFTQHLRRMHADVSTNGTKSGTVAKRGGTLTNAIPEEVIVEHQKRCYIQVRSTPPQSSCLFCTRNFSGDSSWLDRMDHVGNHFERDRKNTVNGGKVTDVDSWREDTVLREWLEEEGLVCTDERGDWTISDGRPLRERGVTYDE